MKLVINNNLFNVKSVMTGKDIASGMMQKNFDNTFDGMLFLVEDGSHSFWMKNCICNLDVIFIKNGKITKVHHNCPPCITEECDHYTGSGDMVLELSGNTCKKYNIKEGDLVSV